MDTIYIVVIAVLAALAVSDLIVGVSNDAVNFLNSAIGSRVASRKVIMAVASVGILFGAVFSNGMMEVARNGIFVPSMFDFHSIMMIFLAVMFTDVILLDMFNTLGMPTSTTVSLVFELLGAAVAVALVTMWQNPEAAQTMSTYINSSKAMGIISGILLSVVISFTVGVIVMFISRLIFSFRYKTSYKYLGAIWCGIALTAISYFAVFKGLKDTTLMSEGVKELINSTTTFMLLLVSFGFWTILMGFFQFIFRLNILKLTVLAGTFALALAFAGNDLVNFIGVFMAGEQSFTLASEAVAGGMSMEEVVRMPMDALAGKSTANQTYLLLAGAIMTLTLWFSKKARKVTDTEINLSRQDSGSERFGSTMASRALVRSARKLNKSFVRVTPPAVQKWIEKRFEPVVAVEADDQKAAFDLIRATVNLACAAILIAIATSLKLPLSTTYVTFMVAMGSSLADRAWGRDTAVYRITGVLAVISGWFLTAFIAFSVAFGIAMFLMYGGEFAIYAMVVLCAFILVQGRIRGFRKGRKEDESKGDVIEDNRSIIERSTDYICDAMESATSIYNTTVDAMFTEDLKALKSAVRESQKLHEQSKERKKQLHQDLTTLQSQDLAAAHYYVQVVDYMSEMAKALLHTTRPAFEYIENNHEGFTLEQIEDLKSLNNLAQSATALQIEMLRSGDYTSMGDTKQSRQQFFETLTSITQRQIERIMQNKAGARSSILYLSIINETKTMLLQSRNLFDSQRRFIRNN